jgi:hypothetical protein
LINETELAPIADFKGWSNQTYELSAIGRTQENAQDSRNPWIECFLTPLIRAADGNYFPDLGAQIRTHIVVGYLPLLFAGRLFRGGSIIDENMDRERRLETLTVRIRPELAEDKKLSQLRGQRVLAPQWIDRGCDVALKHLPAQVTGSNRENLKYAPSPSSPTSMTLLIPDIELIRVYLTQSTYLTQLVFSGAFESEEEIKTHVVYYGREAPRFLEHAPSTYRLVYRIGLAVEDALPIARILTSDRALAAARSVSQSWRSANAAGASGGFTPGLARTCFPYDTQATLTVTGHRMKLSTGQWVFRVMRIASCDAKLPFTMISTCCEFDGGGTKAPPGSPEAGSTNKGSKSETTSGVPRTEQGEARSDLLPGASRIERKKFAASSRVIIGVERIIHEKLLQNTHVAGGTRKTKGSRSPSPHQATGRHSSSATAAQGITLNEDLQTRVALTADLTSFIGLLDQIVDLKRNQGENWVVTYPPVTPDCAFDESTAVQVNFFPLLPCTRRRRLKRLFSYVDKRRKRRRRVLCALVESPAGAVWVLEAEARAVQIDDAGEPTRFEQLPFLILTSRSRTMMSVDSINAVLAATVESSGGTWPTQFGISDLKRKTVARAQSGTAANIAAELADAMRDLLA